MFLNKRLVVDMFYLLARPLLRLKSLYLSLWEGFWGIVIFGVEIENIGNELGIDSDLQVGY